MNSTRRPREVRRKPITAPERKATTNAGAIPFCASRAVRALAYVAIAIPRYPDSREVMAPAKKAIAAKIPSFSLGDLIPPSHMLS
eukprot:4281477-Pyramimonas_sp.AAC.4